jgi:zinc transporter ZupT
MGIIPGTIVFEFLPELRSASTAAVLKIIVGVAGFLVAAAVHAVVRSGLPERHSLDEGQMSSFILAVVTDDVVEGLTLGFASSLSVRLLIFSSMAFLSKNILEGFTEASVLRWAGSRTSRIWAAGTAAAIAVVVAATAAVWLALDAGLGDAGRQLMFAAAVGMLLYVSVFELARNLEWNVAQKLCASVSFALTAATALILEKT